MLLKRIVYHFNENVKVQLKNEEKKKNGVQSICKHKGQRSEKISEGI